MLVVQIDVNKDGVVDREEFVNAFSQVLTHPLRPVTSTCFVVSV